MVDECDKHGVLCVNANKNRSSKTPALAADLRVLAPIVSVVPSAPRGVECSFVAIATGQIQSRQAEVLSVVAHEMRNALNPIRLAAALLGQPGLEEAQLLRSRLVIERQVTRMSQLVNDLFDACRAGNGKFRLELVPVDLARVIAEAIDDCEGCVAAREQRLRVALPPRAFTVRGDPVRLSQIMGNLLRNASTYTPHGGAIEVSVVLMDATVEVTVTDDGIGIAAEVLPDIFEPFVQDPHAVAFDGAGLGIGLSVVRALVQAHGGSIVARSAGHGLGSQFVVTLPVADRAGVDDQGVATASPVRLVPRAPPTPVVDAGVLRPSRNAR